MFLFFVFLLWFAFWKVWGEVGPEGPPHITQPFLVLSLFRGDTEKGQFPAIFRGFWLLLLSTLLLDVPFGRCFFCFLLFCFLPFQDDFSSSIPFQQTFLFFFSYSFSVLLLVLPFPFFFCVSLSKGFPKASPGCKHKLLSLFCCCILVLFGLFLAFVFWLNYVWSKLRVATNVFFFFYQPPVFKVSKVSFSFQFLSFCCYFWCCSSFYKLSCFFVSMCS